MDEDDSGTELGGGHLEVGSDLSDQSYVMIKLIVLLEPYLLSSEMAHFEVNWDCEASF